MTHPNRSEQHSAETDLAVHTERLWNTVVLNDAINHQYYVTYVFRTHFGMTKALAHRLMMRVHEEGRAVVSTDGREKAEAHVLAMHAYGLGAIIEQAQ